MLKKSSEKTWDSVSLRIDTLKNRKDFKTKVLRKDFRSKVLKNCKGGKALKNKNRGKMQSK
jgi:hypothetical protein